MQRGSREQIFRENLVERVGGGDKPTFRVMTWAGEDSAQSYRSAIGNRDSGRFGRLVQLPLVAIPAPRLSKRSDDA